MLWVSYTWRTCAFIQTSTEIHLVSEASLWMPLATVVIAECQVQCCRQRSVQHYQSINYPFQSWSWQWYSNRHLTYVFFRFSIISMALILTKGPGYTVRLLFPSDIIHKEVVYCPPMLLCCLYPLTTRGVAISLSNLRTIVRCSTACIPIAFDIPMTVITFHLPHPILICPMNVV
jgi:hypothetical protein